MTKLKEFHYNNGSKDIKTQDNSFQEQRLKPNQHNNYITSSKKTSFPTI